MEKAIIELENNGFQIKETILYYENRPYPYTEVWVNDRENKAVLIDHGIWEQPACGATWSYRKYAERQNQIDSQYEWLRYSSHAIETLERDLAVLGSLKSRTTCKVQLDPRKVHPQLTGMKAYERQLREQRKQALRGVFVKIVFPL